MNEADIMQSDTSVRRCFEPGKLYRINQYFWYLFPTKEATVAHVSLGYHVSGVESRRVASWAAYWSKAFNCNVSFLNEGDVLMIVEVAGELVKVINQKAVPGWLIFPAAEKWTKDTIIEISDEP